MISSSSTFGKQNRDNNIMSLINVAWREYFECVAGAASWQADSVIHSG